MATSNEAGSMKSLKPKNRDHLRYIAVFADAKNKFVIALYLNHQPIHRYTVNEVGPFSQAMQNWLLHEQPVCDADVIPGAVVD